MNNFARLAKTLLVIVVLCAAAASVMAQRRWITIYSNINFNGKKLAANRDWNGTGGFDRLVRSIRVPSVCRVTLFSDKGFTGQELVITSDWNPGNGAWWINNVRSMRVRCTEVSPVPLPAPIPPPAITWVVIYSQINYTGLSIGMKRDWRGNRAWDGHPYSVRSLRLPSGWSLVVYEKMDFRGRSHKVYTNWAPQPGDWWYGRIRSIRIHSGSTPKPLITEYGPSRPTSGSRRRLQA